MSAEAITDAEVVEVGQEIVPSQPPSLSIAPAGKASELVERLDAIKEAMDTAMVKDTDYGVIPGTGSKPTLLKPGAEKLMALFQLDLQCEEEDTRVGDHLTVKTRAIAFYAPTGARLGYGVGECSTREKKYAYRQEEHVCPSCKQPAIIKGKEEYGGGWLCWNRKGGCGQKFRDGDALIEAQAVGTVDNPNLPDSWNTVRKMAEKRAKVDAVLAVTSASAIFTQDVEDQGPQADTAPSPAAGPYYGPPASKGYLEQTRSAIRYVLDAPDDQAALNRVSEYLTKALPAGSEKPEGLPVAAAIGILGLAAELKERGEAAVHGETLPEVPA